MLDEKLVPYNVYSEYYRAKNKKTQLDLVAKKRMMILMSNQKSRKTQIILIKTYKQETRGILQMEQYMGATLLVKRSTLDLIMTGL